MSARKIVTLASVVSLAACDGLHGEVEEYVASQMRDPSSVQFRNVSTCPNDPDIVQGEYNAKNGFGAYVGFRPFMAARPINFQGDNIAAASVGNGIEALDLSDHVELAAKCTGVTEIEAFRSLRSQYDAEAVDLYMGMKGIE